MGVYSAQYHQNTNELSSIVESANGEDVFGCCSIVLQLEGNDSILSFRRDSNYTADIKVEKINWHGIPAIKQYKEEQGYFTHAIITNDGWMIGMGGIDDGEDSKKCEDIASDGVEGNTGCGLLLGQVQIENVGIGQIQTHAAEMLDHGGERPQAFRAGCQDEHQKLRGYKQEAGQTKGLDP